MAFFDNLSKKVGEVAQNAAKKSGDLLEVNKLNSSIRSEEDEITDLLLEIGKGVYEKYSLCIPTFDNEDFRPICDKIKEHEESIAKLKTKIELIKNN